MTSYVVMTAGPGKAREIARAVAVLPGVEKGTALCQGISPWDEPCLRPATRRCEQCGGWFCQSHFSDEDWHPCAPGNVKERARPPLCSWE